MRYVVALLVAFALIGVGVLFTWHTQSNLQQRVRTTLEAAKPGDFGVELSKSALRRVQIADLLASFWFALVPLTIGVCLTVAAMAKRLGSLN